jgi:regulator of protease activity HflC (stomatin/prohibitin superfamily)
MPSSSSHRTTMRNVVGEVTLDQLLADRAHISEKIQSVVEVTCVEWGIDISNVETQRYRTLT